MGGVDGNGGGSVTLFSSLYGTRLDRELGTDDSTVLFTTTRRKSAINEAQEAFAELTECLQRTSSITITGGVAEYDLTQSTVIPGGDFIRLSKEQVQVRYTDAAGAVTVYAGDNLQRREIEWLNVYVPGWQVSTVASSLQQVPTTYYERTDGGARLLGFYPTPSTGSSAAMDALVPYIARPTPMTSDTNEPFQVSGAVRTDLRPYHQALVHYAAHQLEKLRRDPQASELQLQKFLGYIARFQAQARVKGGKALTFARSYFRPRTTQTDGDPRR
jgi:hypothetical protein